jgi:hypothetical protein
MQRTPIQYAAGTLAGSAFIATTQILTGVALDLPLYVALVAFAINIPFQVVFFFMPVPFSIKEAQQLRATGHLSQWQKKYCLIYCLLGYYSMPAIVIGFVAMFWHFAWWIGILFLLAAWAAYRIFRDSALEDFKQRPSDYK